MTQTALSVDFDVCARIEDSELFDSDWYSKQYRWVAESGVDLIEHYACTGERNNRFPNEYFNPNWYRQQYLKGNGSAKSSLLHYIETGRFDGNLPSPRFCPRSYVRENSGVALEDALSHWLKGSRNTLPPYDEGVVLAHEIEQTGLFDEQWYLRYYPDVEHSGVSPLVHYCTIGIVENRRPNCYFDAEWYLHVNPHVKNDSCPLLHYARHGWRNGKVPSVRFDPATYVSNNYNLKSFEPPVVEPLKHLLLSARMDSNDTITQVMALGDVVIGQKQTIQAFEFRDYLAEPGFRTIRYLCGDSVESVAIRREFSEQISVLARKPGNEWLVWSGCLESVASIFLPDVTLNNSADSILNCFINFISTITDAKNLNNCLFNADLYRSLTESDMSDGQCVIEWATSTCTQSPIPNPYFDPGIYAASTGIVGVNPNDLYRHWLSVGMYENKRFSRQVDLGYIANRLGGNNGENIFLGYLFSQGISFSPRHELLESRYPFLSGSEILQSFNKLTSIEDLRKRIHSGVLRDQIVAAAQYDSKILEHGMNGEISMPPFNSLLAPVVKNIRNELQSNSYDTVLLIPHCRMSGATKIAGKFADCISSLKNEDKILIVLTDKDINKHPEWFPESAEVFSFASLTSKLDRDNKECALFDLLVGIQPKRVINFNSELAWSVFERYGARLATRTALCAYFYCYDINKNGVKVGYPSRYFISTFSYMSMVYFDSDYLRKEITGKNRITSPDDLSRVKTLYTPVEIPSEVKAPAEGTVYTDKIYWAGRLDRQKNFDLVIRIAKLLPDIRFECWGESVIGDYNVEALPGNVVINRPYRNIDEILPGECDLWLYTSRWDGIPNLLLEVGVRQVPLVSTAVWGTTDVLNANNSWLVDDIDNEELYVNAIKECINSKVVTKRKAANLRMEILQRHNEKNYQASIVSSLP